MAPPGMPPPGLPVRKKGGRVHHDDEAEDKALIMKTLRSQGLVRHERAGGGGLQMHTKYGGGSGMGRLEKIGAKPHKIKGGL
jgi:hypothetical protein